MIACSITPGSFWWNRDAHDTRIVNQVRTQTGAIIRHENDVGGFMPPVSISRDAGWDTDHDGMPNHWEIERGLNPNLSSDRNHDYDNDGYTNLEEYLNEAGAWPAPRAITWTGNSGRFALTQNWDAWQPSQYDEARINQGTATVDSVGQLARVVHIAHGFATNATLAITGGKLETFERVSIGTELSKGKLELSSGILSTPRLTKGSEFATFDFTGGVLHAGAVEFDLVNNGGTLAPGNSIGMTHVMGDLALQSGVLEIEIGGTGAGEYDRLVVDGVTTLGGTLRVVPIDLGGGVYVPKLGDQFGFHASLGGTGGEFAHFELPVLADGLEWKILPGAITNFLAVVEAAPLAGDYNDDGIVDAADYVVWRNSLASGAALLNETASLGEVDGEDYTAWKANYGASRLDGGGSGAEASLPESSSTWPLLATLMLLSTTVRRLSCHR